MSLVLALLGLSVHVSPRHVLPGELRVSKVCMHADVPTHSTRDVVALAERVGLEAASLVRDKLGAEVLSTKSTRGDLLTAVDTEVQQLIESSVALEFPGHSFLGEESVPSGARSGADALASFLCDVDSDWLWIVDPIDGTTNFVQSLPLVGISIGVARRGAEGWALACGVIVDPFRNEVFSAVHGGGATLNGKPIAVGTEELADAVVSTGFAPNEASLRPMLRGMDALGTRVRTLRMLGSAAIMLAWVATGRLTAYFEADLNAWDTAAGVLLVREAGGIVTGLNGEDHTIDTRSLVASNARAHNGIQEILHEAGVTGLLLDEAL